MIRTEPQDHTVCSLWKYPASQLSANCMCRISGFCTQPCHREIDNLHNYTHFLQNCPEFFYLKITLWLHRRKVHVTKQNSCALQTSIYLYHALIPQEQISGYSPSNPWIFHPLPRGESLLVVPVVWLSQQPEADRDGSRSDIPPSRRQQWPIYPCQYISQGTASCFSKIWLLWYFPV